MADITVYSYRRCPFAMRVRMTLFEKGISFNVIEENLKDFSNELRAMHPEAKVPVLIHGDHVIYESAIITEYLEDAFPDVPLMPQEAGLRMEVRLWTYWCNQIFKPDLDRFKYGSARLSKEEVQQATKNLSGHMDKIESKLKKSNYLVGDKFTLADIHVFPFIRQLSKVNPAHPHLEKCASVNEWLKKILARSTFEKVMEKNT